MVVVVTVVVVRGGGSGRDSGSGSIGGIKKFPKSKSLSLFGISRVYHLF